MRIDNFLETAPKHKIFSDQSSMEFIITWTYLWLDRLGHWPPCHEPRRPGVTMSAAALMVTMSVITWWGRGAHFAHVRPLWRPTHNWELALVTTPGTVTRAHRTPGRALSWPVVTIGQCLESGQCHQHSRHSDCIGCNEQWAMIKGKARVRIYNLSLPSSLHSP